MAEYIDRDLFAREVNRLSTNPFNEWDTMGILLLLDTIPSADVQPVVRGRWMCTALGNYACSYCAFEPYYSGSIETLNYCPNCGARMEVKTNETVH